MKVVIVISVIIILMLTFMFVGCTDNESPQIVYGIGAEHVFGDITIKVEHDEEQEQFIMYYNIPEESTWTHYFGFTFSYDAKDFKNSDQFDYSDNLNSEINFDGGGESKYYEFYTSRIFYISYKNANSEIKNSINSKTCSLEFPIGTFEFLRQCDN